MTSDEIGTVLVELTAALAKKGLAEAVTIPICDTTGSDHRTAELVIGQGNDVLAVPVDGGAVEPEFAAEAESLRSQLRGLIGSGRSVAVAQPSSGATGDESEFDYDLDLTDFGELDGGTGTR